ncbi:Eef2k, partial [Symbiodinium sp. CCMP2456]
MYMTKLATSIAQAFPLLWREVSLRYLGEVQQQRRICQRGPEQTQRRGTGILALHIREVVDLQGVCEERNSELVFRLTDPQVHSSRKWKRQSESFPERFGKGDFGEDGFSAFFQNYVYNKLSKDLGLRDELDVREPTETAYIPAVREYFEEFKTWLSHAREQLEWDLNEYCGPQEFYDNAYWFPVKIWAKKTNAQKALQDIQDKVEAVLAKRLRKLPV